MRFIKRSLMLMAAALAVLFHQQAHTQTVLRQNVFGNGGDVAANSTHRLAGTAGQTAIGAANSTSYMSKLGFWYPIANSRVPAENLPPVVYTPIPDQKLKVGESFSMDLYDAPPVFFDPNYDALIFTARSSDALRTTATIAESKLTVTALDTGRTTITVIAEDGRGGVVQDIFIVTAMTRGKVYVISSGNTNADQAVLQALSTQGFSPTLGVQPHEWNGTQADLKKLKIVVLLNSYNWAGNSMPEAGQAALLNFVNGGGGLVTGEWLIWNIDLGDRHKNLGVMMPAKATGVHPGGLPTNTYTQATADAIINKGLPASFDFPLKTPGNPETILQARTGATVYYSSRNSGQSGVAGWNYSAGRVISFSTLLSNFELVDADYVKLFANTVEWAGARPPAVNHPPLVVNPIPDQTLARGASFTRDLNTVFSDPDNDFLTYAASSSNESKARATIAGSTLTVSTVDSGNVKITITADDWRGGKSQTSFSVTVMPPPPAKKIYVISSGNSAADGAVMNALASSGYTPTLGAQPHEWNGTQANLNDYKVVVLLNSYNWAGNSMPDAGQTALLNFVNSGGGLVTGEWLIWNIDLGDRHKNLGVMMPAKATGVHPGGLPTNTYTQATADAIINKGLPASFDFPLKTPGNPETILQAKTGATVYYSSRNSGQSGVAGWNYGAGRVISFSTLLSEFELVDADYVRLFANTVEWAGTPSSAPPASPIYVMGSGNATADQAVVNALTAQGLRPTLGVQPHEWNNTQARLADFKAVVVLNSANFGAGSMPEAGQTALLNYVNSGGGMITGEWFIWNIDLGNRHKNLDPLVPADATGFKAASTTIYSQVTTDAIINNGIGAAFDFPMNAATGSESLLNAKTGATVFYNSSNTGRSGLIGWSYGTGRVLSFSSLITDVELADADYARLLGNSVRWVTAGLRKNNQATGTDDAGHVMELPTDYRLEQNYPNPFWSEATSRFAGNPETTIQYAIPGNVSGPLRVTLRIYNLHGQVVRTLVDEQKSPGRYRAVWDGKNELGAKIATGMYLYTITASGFKASKRMTVLK